jgi:hypothetical protein
MNQAILFSDNERYNEKLKQVEFTAQSQNALITCIISLDNLYLLNELSDVSKNINEQTILNLFDSVRFDIEEIAEKMIDDQQLGHDGKLYLTLNQAI